ncbi:hypothetical protein PR202_gb00651 [Eleusine coracana subsp. coracana]|uniref:RING-type domain-containing protein n=1 Tax=Eleusine coracana subsp. coracana TaxID=191504 RepID=A0AAV5DTX3_ELECO|nr:hypothetical protein PR202_gb00651 [Eleusine coracana subsp. coracana]
MLRTVVRLLPPPPDSTLLAEGDACPDAGGAAGKGAGEAGGGLGGPHGGGAGEGGGLDGGGAGKGGGLHGCAGDKGGGTEADAAAEAMEGGATAEGGGLAGQEPQDQPSPRAGRTIQMFITNPSTSIFMATLYRHSGKKCGKSPPLVFHDKELLDASRFIHDEEGVALRKDRGSDFTHEITSVLNNHPGPVSNFRVDSSVWSGGSGQLGIWMSMLSRKGIQEVVIINSALPTDVSFPITALESTELRSLSLGFLSISDLAIGAFEYSSLTELRLFGCTYDGQALSAVISECSSLRELVIGFSVHDVSIISQSLVSIKMFNSNATSFTIDYAPKLQILSTGVSPRNRGQPVLIDINSSHALKEIYCWMLPHHSITIRSVPVEGLICLPNVQKLRLGLAMADPHQRSGLLSSPQSRGSRDGALLRSPWWPDVRSQQAAAAGHQDFDELDKLRAMPCAHAFHEDCIFRWLRRNATCPLCRHPLSSEAQETA